MPNKRPADFTNHNEWLTYVDSHVSPSERAYALACGRTELFKSFYGVRQQIFPGEYVEELQRIHVLAEPQRTNALESLNDRIFANMTDFLFNATPSSTIESEIAIPISEQNSARNLLDHLVETSLYFAFWTAYKMGVRDGLIADEWEDYLIRELGAESPEEVEFTRAMADLDKLLGYFRDKNLPLPRFLFERIWFLHYLCGPERALHTRAILHTLAEEIAACTSA